jgi:hypothetical protein
MTYRQAYSNLWATSLTREQHERTCGYWFTVTHGPGTAHTAFATRAGLDRWLSERGLSLENDLPEAGTWGNTRIAGEYREESHGEFVSDDYRDGMGEGDFYSLRPVLATQTWSNGRITLALITEEDGIRTVHTLNPNVKTRVEFDHHKTRELMR